MKDKSIENTKLLNFSIKQRRGLLLDNVTRLEKTKTETNEEQDMKKDFWRNRYQNIQLTSAKCDSCELLEGPNHYMVCPAGTDKREKLKKNVQQMLNSKLEEPTNVTILGAFWEPHELRSKDPKPLIPVPGAFPPRLGAAGMFPISTTTGLKKLKWKKETNMDEILKQLQILILTTHRTMWIERCKTFYQQHQRTETIDRTALKERIKQEKETQNKKKQSTQALLNIRFNSRKNSNNKQPTKNMENSNGKAALFNSTTSLTPKKHELMNTNKQKKKPDKK